MTSSHMTRVPVSLGERSYEILIGAGLLVQAGELLKPLGLGQRGVVITDCHVGRLYAKRFCQGLTQAGYQVTELMVPAGESSKSLRQVVRLLEKLPALQLDRNSFVIALGGGVVGDLAGFVAASYLRGIQFIQVPTSLLAMVDSSVGGKTGVNLPQGKNLVGAFYQPRLVLADIEVLRTLPKRELRSGFAEVIKTAAIRDARFFKWLEQHGQEVLALEPAAVIRAVRRCCEIKGEVVGADERESGLRAILNFGHTIGHAMETLRDYHGLLHGEAVATGMVCAAELSVKHAGLPRREADRLRALVVASRLPVRVGRQYAVADLLEATRLDKKAKAGKVRFVLLPRLGQAVTNDAVTDADIEEVVDVCR